MRIVVGRVADSVRADEKFVSNLLHLGLSLDILCYYSDWSRFGRVVSVRKHGDGVLVERFFKWDDGEKTHNVVLLAPFAQHEDDGFTVEVVPAVLPEGAENTELKDVRVEAVFTDSENVVLHVFLESYSGVSFELFKVRVCGLSALFRKRGADEALINLLEEGYKAYASGNSQIAKYASV